MGLIALTLRAAVECPLLLLICMKISLGKLVEKFDRNMRLCARCGVGLFCEVDTYCKWCWDDFLRNRPVRGVVPERYYGIEVYSLFEWKPDDPFMRNLVYRLKGESNKTQTFARLSGLFRMTRSHQGILQCPCFIPAPAKDAESRDHAFQ